MGEYAKLEEQKLSEHNDNSWRQLSIPLGNLQYGQSRDIVLKYVLEGGNNNSEPTILATLDCTSLDNSPTDLFVQRSISDITDLPSDILQYHRTRATICSLLSTLFPLNVIGEHYNISPADLPQKRDSLDAVIFVTKLLNLTDEYNASLFKDLAGPNPSGQIKLALSTKEYFIRWGKHYLLSLMNAHQNQICNSFKDPGPLMYGRESPLFIKCRDALDYAFDHLPPPTPSNLTRDKHGNMIRKKVDVRRYNRSSNGCFAGECLVELADGKKIAVEKLRKDMRAWTPLGERKVAAVVATQVTDYGMCRIGELVITDWHPVFADGRWVFPGEVAEERVTYSGSIFSVLLEPHPDPEAHAIRVGGHLVVTLGHGVTATPAGSADVRAHDFLGNYEKVVKSLERLMVWHNGIHISMGMLRDEATGLVSGFLSTKRLAKELGSEAFLLERVVQSFPFPEAV
jgi:hypothetical protein